MQTARRLYLYVMSGITLAVIATGLMLLLRVTLDGFFPHPNPGDYGGYDNSREQLSQAIAMLGVGTPVWAVHWWLVQRGLREGRPERDAERGNGIRAIYITSILFASLFVWVTAATALLQWLVTDTLHLVPEYWYQDPLGSATTGVTAFPIWLYHGLVRRRDLGAGPVSGPAAWVPRLYLYGVSMAAGFAALTMLQSVVSSALWAPAPEPGSGDATMFYLAQEAVSAIAWAVVWLGHWTYANRLARDPGWRGTEERVSRARVAAFVAIVIVAATTTLGAVESALSAVLRPILPSEPSAGFVFEAQSVVAPLLSAALWAVVWWSHGRALRREPAAAEPLRALHQERLVGHGVAAAALAMGATGAGWVIGAAIDQVLGGQRDAFGSAAGELALFVPMSFIGLGAWAWFWRPVIARHRADPVREAGSTIRRVFLYLTFGVALVVAIASAAVILYRFVGQVIGAALGGNPVSELSTPLGALAVAATILAYHGLALRRDQRLVADAAPAAAESTTPEPASAHSAGAFEMATQRRSFALVGPAGADLDAALAAARAVMPNGVELVSEDG